MVADSLATRGETGARFGRDNPRASARETLDARGAAPSGNAPRADSEARKGSASRRSRHNTWDFANHRLRVEIARRRSHVFFFASAVSRAPEN
jgi:hypothetical protein